MKTITLWRFVISVGFELEDFFTLFGLEIGRTKTSKQPTINIYFMSFFAYITVVI